MNKPYLNSKINNFEDEILYFYDLRIKIIKTYSSVRGNSFIGVCGTNKFLIKLENSDAVFLELVCDICNILNESPTICSSRFLYTKNNHPYFKSKIFNCNVTIQYKELIKKCKLESGKDIVLLGRQIAEFHDYTKKTYPF